MKKITWGNAVVSVLMAFAFGVFGFFVTARLVQKLVRGEFASWHSMGTPPEHAVRFLGLNPHVNGGHDADVYIETVTGKVYRYACCSQSHAKWQEAEAPQGLWSGCCRLDDTRDIPPPPYFANLPARVKECEEILWEKEWTADTSFFVLLEDHSVWWRRQYVGLGTVFAFLLGGPTIGAILGTWLSSILTRHCPDNPPLPHPPPSEGEGTGGGTFGAISHCCHELATHPSGVRMTRWSKGLQCLSLFLG